MKAFDKDGLLLCNLQATTFEMSIETESISSEVFIRRFMNSQVAKDLDNESALQTSIQPQTIFDRLEEQYGSLNYGSVKYNKNEIYWIGYIYRYFSYTYELSSVRVYKTIKPKELRELFVPYHSMDPSQAIERILEAKNLIFDEKKELERQYNIFKKIRNAQQ